MRFISFGCFVESCIWHVWKRCRKFRRKCCIHIKAFQVFVLVMCPGVYEVCEVGVGVREQRSCSRAVHRGPEALWGLPQALDDERPDWRAVWEHGQGQRGLQPRGEAEATKSGGYSKFMTAVCVSVLFVSVVEKVPSLGRPVAADVRSWGESGTVDQSQSNPGEGPTEEPTQPRALVTHFALICLM